MDRMLRVNMTDLTVTQEPFPQAWDALGGRALTAKILLQEVDATCDPLGPKNKLIFAPGVLTGSAAPTSGRISVGAKSPLTGGIKEANSGGQAGQKLMRVGIRAVIVEGQPKDPAKRYLLDINQSKAELRECPELKGLRTYATSERLAAQTSKRAAFIICGPAGEQRLSGASVATTDQDERNPSRHAARGGLGAVMGAKGLKAVIVDDEGSTTRPAKDAEAFRKHTKQISKDYLAGPQPIQYGTATFTPFAGMLSSLPTHNRRAMQFEGAESLGGMIIQNNYATHGGKQHNCMTGCIVQCSNTVNDANGKYITSALEFETVALLGSNCDIADIYKVAELDRLCDDLGLDTIETGGAMGLAMDSGALAFGDADAAIKLLDSLDKGNELAATIGCGVEAVAKRYNTQRVSTVRGQGLPAWEPRTLPVAAVTYATSAMGADHTAGLSHDQPSDPVQVSQELQITNALMDSSGFCMFQAPTIENIRELYNAVLGKKLTFEDMLDLGWQCLEDEWEFNRRAGFKPADDDVPGWMRTEVVPSTGGAVAIPKEELQRMFTRMPISDGLRSANSVSSMIEKLA